MATADSVKTKMQGLIASANAKTGASDATLTDAVNTLIAGFGSGDLKLTSACALFYGGERLDQIDVLLPLLKEDVKNFSNMFNGCEALISIPELDTSNGTNFSSMFNRCLKIETIPELNTSNGTNFSNMFNECRTVASIPKLNTSNGTNFGYMFQNCYALKSIYDLDVNNGTSFASTFNRCNTLTNLYLYNIRKAITIGSGTTYGHLLSIESLVHTIKELCTVSTSQTLTMGSANLEKIASLYCKITDDTTEKKTMELCESTDDGAMTLSDYAMVKNWIIQ